MFKLIKWSFYTVAVIMVAGMFLSDPHEDSVFAGPTAEELALKAEAKAEKEAELKAIADAKAKAKAEKEAADLAYRNSPEGKTKAFSVQAHGLCRAHVKASAKFPSKVDFDWGSNKKIFNNFSEGKSRIMIQNKGEMMNGLGLMIPFKATCKYDYDPETNTYSVVEILI